MNEQKESGWIWKFYFVFFSLIIARKAAGFFMPGTNTHDYYKILTAFASYFEPLYWTNAVTVILNLACLVPLFLFAYRIHFLPSRVWQYLLGARLIFDILGHSYEYMVIRSFFYSSPWIGMEAVSAAIFLVAPSYWACFQYAFRRKKFIPHQKRMF